MEKTLIRRLVVVLLSLVILTIIIAAVYLILMKPRDGEIVYGDYTISKGHYGKIEKYDSSATVEGYKGSKDKAYYITGKLKSSKNKGFTIITFNLYDKSDKLLGTAVAGLNELEKDKSYDFKALSLVTKDDMEKINHYKIESIKQGK